MSKSARKILFVSLASTTTRTIIVFFYIFLCKKFCFFFISLSPGRRILHSSKFFGGGPNAIHFQLISHESCRLVCIFGEYLLFSVRFDFIPYHIHKACVLATKWMVIFIDIQLLKIKGTFRWWQMYFEISFSNFCALSLILQIHKFNSI